MNTACFGLDPYEPNDATSYVVTTRTLTLRAMLCAVDDQDWFSFPVTVGDRVRITPRILSNGVNGSGADREHERRHWPARRRLRRDPRAV